MALKVNDVVKIKSEKGVSNEFQGLEAVVEEVSWEFIKVYIPKLHVTVWLDQIYLEHVGSRNIPGWSCECGSNFTSNRKFHYKWCVMFRGG